MNLGRCMPTAGSYSTRRHLNFCSRFQVSEPWQIFKDIHWWMAL